MCHINMLKPYFARSPVSPAVVSTVAQVPPSEYSPESDGLLLSHGDSCTRLQNSDYLKNLQRHLKHLDLPVNIRYLPVNQESLTFVF